MRELLYNLALGVGLLAASPILAARLAKGRYRAISLARLGLGAAWLPGDAPGAIWLHALSVGEVRSAVPLLEALARRFPDKPLAFSVATAQGLATARELLAQRPEVVLFTRPLDLRWNVERVLSRLRPSLFVLVEGDIWPGWSWGLKRRGAPSLLVNSRVSPRTYRGYRRMGPLARGLLGDFDRILAQTRVDHERLLKVGLAPGRVARGGNLKFDTAPPALDQAAREVLARELGLAGRPVLVAGSTHPGEETACLEAYQPLLAEHPDLALIIAPREVARGAEVARLCEARGLSVARLSQGAPPAACQVLVLDVLGRLAAVYALAAGAFVGGSLTPIGGHNLLEPAAQGVPVFCGPHTHNFLEMARDLIAAGGGMRVSDASGLLAGWRACLEDPDLAASMGAAAREFVAAHRGALARAVEEAARLLGEGEA